MQPQLPTPLDILVVLDDTTAMQPHLPRRGIDQLGIIPYIYNGAPDVRWAVTTSTTGTLRTSAAVPTGIIEERVDFTDGTLHTNYNDFPTAVASLTNVGAASTAPNAVLDSIQRAIATPGFARKDSGVGVFVLSAGDDASPNDPLTYASFAIPNPVMLSTVIADAAPRISAFADAIPRRYAQPMDKYNMESLTVFSWLFKPIDNTDYCLPVTASREEGRFDCELFTSHEQVVSLLPECGAEALGAPDACWQIIEEPSCASGRGLLLGGPYMQYRPRIIGRCAVD
jgi:hypothetical protein